MNVTKQAQLSMSVQFIIFILGAECIDGLAQFHGKKTLSARRRKALELILLLDGANGPGEGHQR